MLERRRRREKKREKWEVNARKCRHLRDRGVRGQQNTKEWSHGGKQGMYQKLMVPEGESFKQEGGISGKSRQQF